MPTRRSCSFCGNEIEPGTGKMFIRKDGTVFLFCSHKCQSNMLKLGRVPRWTPWTQAFRRAAGRVVPEEAVVTEEAPVLAEGAAEVTIETPRGKDIPADLSDLIDKRLGPDLSRGNLEQYFSDFVKGDAFRTSILGWTKKKHGAKPVTHVDNAALLARKDSPEARRVFNSCLRGQAQEGEAGERERGAAEPATPT